MTFHVVNSRLSSGKRQDRAGSRRRSIIQTTNIVAAHIRKRRADLRITQDELADLAGCSSRFIRELEAGKQTVRLDKTLDVLGALGLDLVIQPRVVQQESTRSGNPPENASS